MSGVERLREVKKIDLEVLEPEEVWALVRAADDEQDAAIYLTAAFTGMRMGELRALRWRDVDFPRSLVRVRASYSMSWLTTPKSGKVRAVPLAPDVASALARLATRGHHVGEEDLVFPGDLGGYLDDSALRRRYKAALARAGLRQLRFHDLRHTFGTRMIAKARHLARQGVDWARGRDHHDEVLALHAQARGRGARGRGVRPAGGARGSVAQHIALSHAATALRWKRRWRPTRIDGSGQWVRRAYS